MKQTFIIEQRLTGYNEHERKRRSNKYRANADKVRQENIIGWRIRKARLNPVSVPQWVVFEWHEKTKRRDKDNVASAKKFVLDALQKTGILPKDSNRYIEGFTDRFIYDKTDKVIVILVDYIEEKEDGQS